MSNLEERQVRFWEQSFFQGSCDYPLSSKLTEFIKEYCQTHQVGDKIIELACGLNPCSDYIANQNPQNRLLVDIVDLSNIYQERNPRTTFIQADLNQSLGLVQRRSYRDYLDSMGGSFDTLVIGSGINYFNWKKNIPLFLKDLKVGGLVFLYTGIFDKNYYDPGLHETVDWVNRPENTTEVIDFFYSHGFIFEELQTPYYSPTSQQQILLCARKTDRYL